MSPPPLQADADPDRPTTQQQRQMIYTADVNLLAFNVNSEIDQARTLATQRSEQIQTPFA